MNSIWGQLSENQLFATLVFFLAMVGLRFCSNQWLDRHSKLEAESKRRFKSNIKNALFLLTVIALIFLWAPALRTFALSLTAFAVAIILATKELILCISGYILKSTGGMIRVGDWIEVNGMRGEVVDQNMMTTTLEELGVGLSYYDYTGRTIIIPNSTFLSTTVKNERFNRRYTYHSCFIVVKPEVPIQSLQQKLGALISSELEKYTEVSRRYKALIETRADINLPKKDIDQNITFQNDGNIKLALVYFCPVEEAIGIENKVKEVAMTAIEEFYRGKS